MYRTWCIEILLVHCRWCVWGISKSSLYFYNMKLNPHESQEFPNVHDRLQVSNNVLFSRHSWDDWSAMAFFWRLIEATKLIKASRPVYILIVRMLMWQVEVVGNSVLQAPRFRRCLIREAQASSDCNQDSRLCLSEVRNWMAEIVLIMGRHCVHQCRQLYASAQALRL